jgi:2-keto-4-pentenoate hydratase
MSPPSDAQAAAWAERIDAAHRRGQLLEPITAVTPLTLVEGYQIQKKLTARRLDAGAVRVGWKLGYTSEAMRKQMRVSEPNYGPLLDAMLVHDGTMVPEGLSQPRVEPEIALRLADELRPGYSPAEAASVVEGAFAALEIVDSVWVDYQFTLADNTADGSSAAGFVLGSDVGEPLALDRIEVELTVDGAPMAHGRGSDGLGHPLNAVCWLASALADGGERLRAGDVVLTGGLTAAVPLPAGGRVSARFSSGAQVSVLGGAVSVPADRAECRRES